MHLHHDHIGGHCHDHEHTHTHEHTHDGVTHSHEHAHAHEHDHEHPHTHEHLHEHNCEHHHDHDHECGHCHDHEHHHGSCGGGCQCKHSPMEELTALMKYMVGHNAAHAKELADLANQLENAGNHMAYEQVMAAVSDFEKGNLRLSAVLASLQ